MDGWMDSYYTIMACQMPQGHRAQPCLLDHSIYNWDYEALLTGKAPLVNYIMIRYV